MVSLSLATHHTSPDDMVPGFPGSNGPGSRALFRGSPCTSYLTLMRMRDTRDNAPPVSASQQDGASVNLFGRKSARHPHRTKCPSLPRIMQSSRNSTRFVNGPRNRLAWHVSWTGLTGTPSTLKRPDHALEVAYAFALFFTRMQLESCINRTASPEMVF